MAQSADEFVARAMAVETPLARALDGLGERERVFLRETDPDGVDVYLQCIEAMQVARESQVESEKRFPRLAARRQIHRRVEHPEAERDQRDAD
ncbi:MAG: hypothetical protein KAJ42_11135 [Gemmatimonadetes bacterium]|nr:hypothetical protein [Gemmatimonadota bacterium]